MRERNSRPRAGGGPARRGGPGSRGTGSRGPAGRGALRREGGPQRGGTGATGGGGAQRPKRAAFGRAARAKPPLNVRRAPVPSDPDRLIARQPWAALRPLIPGDDAHGERAMGRLRDYSHRLLAWNRGVSNLISRGDEPRLVSRHLLESLAPARELLETGFETFIDLGSGAGLPAFPLVIAGVGKRWKLVEARRNKTLFMRKTQGDMKLREIEVVTARLETLAAGELGPPADAFTSRATMLIGPTLEMAAAHVRPGGMAFLWKGSRWTAEMEESRPHWEPQWRFERSIPIGEGPNLVAVFVRL